jgi:putative heme degradation protein
MARHPKIRANDIAFILDWVECFEPNPDEDPEGVQMRARALAWLEQTESVSRIMASARAEGWVVSRWQVRDTLRKVRGGDV